MSATDQAFAFGDNHNFVYVHGICDKFHINTTPKQAEYADTPLFPSGPYYPLVVATGGDGSNNTGGGTAAAYYGNHTPVSEMGGPGGAFPYYAFPKLADFRSLLSHMPAKACQRTYRPTPPIAPEILRSMRVVGNIGYVVNNNSGGGGGAAAAAVAAVMGGHHAAAAAAFAANGALLNSRRSRCFGVLF